MILEAIQVAALYGPPLVFIFILVALLAKALRKGMDMSDDE